MSLYKFTISYILNIVCCVVCQTEKAMQENKKGTERAQSILEYLLYEKY